MAAAAAAAPVFSYSGTVVCDVCGPKWPSEQHLPVGHCAAAEQNLLQETEDHHDDPLLILANLLVARAFSSNSSSRNRSWQLVRVKLELTHASSPRPALNRPTRWMRSTVLPIPI